MKLLLEQQSVRKFEHEVWTDSSSAKAIMQRLGPGRREKHCNAWKMLQTFAGVVVYTFPGEETAKFQAYTSISQNY